MAIRVFLLDDHEVVRRGVRDMLEEAGLDVVGEASTAEEAVRRIPAILPDVAVLDVRLPDGSGVEVCREVRSQLPDLACLMLTSFSDDDGCGMDPEETRRSGLRNMSRRAEALGGTFEVHAEPDSGTHLDWQVPI